MPASEIRDQLVQLEDLWSEISEIPGTQVAGAQRLRWLARLVLDHRAEPDLLVRAASAKFLHGDVRIGMVAADLGVSERQLHRRMTAAVGYGPKTLLRIVRLRRLIELKGPLADRAHIAGYASQAHMSDEVRRLTGLTPVRFLKDARLTAA